MAPSLLLLSLHLAISIHQPSSSPISKTLAKTLPPPRQSPEHEQQPSEDSSLLLANRLSTSSQEATQRRLLPLSEYLEARIFCHRSNLKFLNFFQLLFFCLNSRIFCNFLEIYLNDCLFFFLNYISCFCHRFKLRALPLLPPWQLPPSRLQHCYG